MTTAIRHTIAAMPVGRRIVLVVTSAAIAVMLLIVAASVVIRSSESGHANDAAHILQQQSPNAGGELTTPTPTLTPDASAALSADLQHLSAAPVVAPATSPDYPAIPAGQRAQPDIYARAFATELLTQHYRTDRAALLAWVQSETVPTSEPLVVGLVPDQLRPKLGVWTVTDATSDTDPPIPTDADWHAWAARGGNSNVEIVRVTEPSAWADAVAGGRITDPGVAARDVDAVVTTSWQRGGVTVTTRRSVFLSLTLEGPPTRADYGYVNTVAYRSVPIGG